MKTKFKMLTLSASLLACGLGMSGNAQANAYALSYNNVFNGKVTQSPVGSAVFIIPNTTTSQASASLTGFASVNNIDPLGINALPANLGVAKANDDFTVVGQFGTYTRGDSQIVSQQTATPGSSLQAVNIAEGNIVTSGIGSASGRDASDTSFSVPFTVVGASVIQLDFSADPFMKVFLDGPPSFAPSNARAELTANVNITDSLGNTVFNWSPNGSLLGVKGGTALSDPFTLNTSIARNFAFPGTTPFDPLGKNGADVGNLSPLTSGFFSVKTDALGKGDYTLTLQIRENIDVQRTVPEPATMALMGLGMLGMSFARRRKQA